MVSFYDRITDMKSKVILLTIISTLLLTSCDSLYVEGAFFDKKTLEECEISELPTPEGKLLRYGSNSLYVNSDDESRNNYIESVFDYIKTSNFKHLYAVKYVSRGVVAPVPYYGVYVFEGNSLTDFYYESENSYWFIYSNNEIKKNDDEKDIIDAHIITVFRDNYVIKYDNKEFKMTYEIRLVKEHTCFIVSEE